MFQFQKLIYYKFKLRSDMADIHCTVKELNIAKDKQEEKYKNEIEEVLQYFNNIISLIHCLKV